MFTHESGIQSDGLKNTSETFSPEEVGLERQTVIGKHSGTSAIINKFKEYGILLEKDEARLLLERVRSLAVKLKRVLFDKELVYLYQDLKLEQGEEWLNPRH